MVEYIYRCSIIYISKKIVLSKIRSYIKIYNPMTMTLYLINLYKILITDFIIVMLKIKAKFKYNK